MCLQAAVAQDPGNVDAMANLGLVLVESGKAEHALPWLEQALQERSEDGRIGFNLAYALQRAGHLNAAAAAYQQVLEREPGCWEAWQNLAVVLRKQGDLQAAIDACQRVLDHDPHRSDVLREKAIVFYELGDEARAGATVQSAAEQKPTELAYRYPAITIEAIPLNRQEITASRVRFLQHVLGLASDSSLSLDAGLPFNPSFWLSYHNADDRPLLEAVHTVFATPRRSSANSPKPRDRRSRVGLISSSFGEKPDPCHVIQLLYGPLLTALEQAPDLEPVLLAAPSLSTFQEESIQAAESCTLLFYLDVDLNPDIWCLAHDRLAPIQVTSWGNPNTTGMASIDYYLSAEAMEPPGADALYTETLIRFSRLPCIYTPPTLDGIQSDRAGFQLSATELLIGIPQSLFKLHPDYDLVLERIVQLVPNSRLVLLEGSRPHHTTRLKQRWAQSVPQVLDRANFLPRLSRERYLTLLDTVDILLDPFFFGSGNSFYEAMAIGTPLVTLPGRYMRGRIVAGGYKQMGLEHQAPIATSAENYIQWVQRLAADPELRSMLKALIRTAAAQHLFNDQTVAAEFIAFFRAAIAASHAGQRLPPGWQPASNTPIPTADPL
jgi:predicted O-linked N-acetylglucosamine transferase (SPINDLY family)